MPYPPAVFSFVKRVALILTPVFLLFGVLSVVSFYAGELTPISHIVDTQMQHNEPTLFGRSQVERETRRYKYMATKATAPSVLALGSSRAMQLREEMFVSPYTFYNGGGMISHADHLIDFMHISPEEQDPELLFLAIDPWWFSTTHHRNADAFVEELATQEAFFDWRAHIHANRYILTELIRTPAFAQRLLKKEESLYNTETFGLDALTTGRGFRNDGSRQYGNHIRAMRENPTFVDREGPPIYLRLREGLPPFSHDSTFDPKALASFEQFLTQATQRGITVIGFSPPFSSESYALLETTPYAPYFSSYRHAMTDIFATHDLIYKDYSDLTTLDLDDEYMFDGFHATDTALAYIVRDLFESLCANEAIDTCDDQLRHLDMLLSDENLSPFELLPR